LIDTRIAMNIQIRREIRFGLSALVVTGLLFTLSVVVRGPLDRDPAVLMQAVLSPNFVPGVVIGLIGGVLSIYGNFFGLYRYLTLRDKSLIPFLAIVLSPLGLMMFVLPFVTFLAVNVPVIAELYQQGNHEVLAVFHATFTNPLSLALLGGTSVTGVIGTLLFAISIWRDGRLSKWVAVGWALRGLLLIISGPGFFATELLGAVLALILSSVIAWHGWQESLVRITDSSSSMRTAVQDTSS
jgi:hypothetical protein